MGENSVVSLAKSDVEDILQELTLPEKNSLLAGTDFWHINAIPRVGIRSTRMSDGPNGVRGSRLFNGVPAACFPCGTGLAATWDTELIERGGELMGKEALAKGASIILGPTVNMQRSPIGGRGFESFSEDPVLAGNIAAATVKGIQSTGVVATIKHFVGNDQEEQRQSVDSVIPARALREIYLLPFQIAQRDAKPLAYMTAYNKLNGTACSENKALLQGILRDEWGFDGIVMSDWYGTYSTTEALNAGLDVEMPGPTRWRGTLTSIALNTKKVTPRTLDDRARAVLKIIKHIDALNIPNNPPEGNLNTPETSRKLRDIATSGIVLLKNDNNILPLRKDKSIAVIGPNAKFAAYSGGGSAALRPYYAITPFEGVAAKATSVEYALGAIGYKNLPMLTSITTSPDGSKGMEMRIYLDPPSVKDRKPVDTFNITEANCFLMDYKHPAIKTNLFYAEIEGTIVPEKSTEYLFSIAVAGTARLFIDGEEVVDNETNQRPGDSFFGSGTAQETGSKFLNKDQKHRVIVQFCTKKNSLGRPGAFELGIGGVQMGGTPKTDPTTLLNEAVALAKKVHQVVLAIGLNSEWESEGWDRDNMDLPPGVDALVAAVAAANPNTVVVNQSGTPVTFPWASSVPAIVQAWYGGNEGGNAIADVLFGDVNPSGKLPLSWPIRLEDNPAFINTRVDGGKVYYGEGIFVGYRWYEKTRKDALFPFGHGLSYTTFSLSNLSVKATNSTLSVSVDVSNTGSRDGSEVVQVYVSQRKSGVQRPGKELKGFAKVHVHKGQKVTAKVDIELKYAGSYWDEVLDSWLLEKGEYDVLVGNSSASVELKGEFEVQKEVVWKGL